jgi:hypothetical protein
MARSDAKFRGSAHGAFLTCPVPESVLGELPPSYSANSPFTARRVWFELVVLGEKPDHVEERVRMLYAERALDSPSVRTSLRRRLASSKNKQGTTTREKNGDHHFFEIAMCTTVTASSYDGVLLEWLAFHRRLGVEHFFIYDQSRKAGEFCRDGRTSRLVASGLVTCVEFPYSSCGEARTNRPWRSPTAGRFQDAFYPAMNQHRALDSCYTRFSQFADWLGNWDTDEWAAPVGRHRSYTTLIRQQQLEGVAALAFEPYWQMPLDYCTRPERAALERILGGDALRRRCSSSGGVKLDSWCLRSVTKANNFETKLLMRTSLVRTFHVHYLQTLRDESADVNKAARRLNASTEGIILHLKSKPLRAAAVAEQPDAPYSSHEALGIPIHKGLNTACVSRDWQLGDWQLDTAAVPYLAGLSKAAGDLDSASA